MKKFAQIIDDKVHWVFESVERPPYPDDVQIVDVTGLDIKEGYIYHPETKGFTPPKPQLELEPRASLEEIAEETLLETKYQTFILEVMM